MLNVPTGLSHQIALSGFLKHMGYRLMEDDDLDHDAKCDFVVAKLPSFPKMVSLGVQLTTRPNDIAKRTEFFARNSPSENGGISVVDRALYIEYDTRVDMAKGGANLVSSAIYAFLFDEQYADKRVWGVAIRSSKDSICYSFFDPCVVEERATGTNGIAVAGPVAVPHIPASTPTPIRTPVRNLSGSVGQLQKSLRGETLEIEGRMHTFMTNNGYGFIAGQDGSTYYVHRNDCSHEIRTEIDKL
ncbi:MAG TPA: hypothetical protein VE866_03600, partial [Candidatus Binatia bacterium]|nr:hypothetical protein [Candidatus Binatia bacterium]